MMMAVALVAIALLREEMWTRQFLLKLCSLGAVIASVIWAAQTPDWRSLSAAFASVGALLKLEMDDLKGSADPDRELFAKFLQALPYDGAISFLASRPLHAGSFKGDVFIPLYDFAQGWNDAAHEFHLPQLESRKKRLQVLANEFADAMGDHSFPVQGSPNRHEIPREWRETDPARYKQATSELEDLAREVVTAHQDFVRVARRKLRM
jgi:hypothetical protein